MQAGVMRTSGMIWLMLVLVAGCAGSRERLKQSLLAERNPAAHARDLDLHYRVQHPDVLQVQVEGYPGLSSSRSVGLDGRIEVARGVYVAVDGLTTLQVAREVAGRLGVPVTSVRVQVAKYASQHLYLFGEVGAKSQVVEYRGPETVVDLLQRIGGPSPGAALGDIRIVRANVASGKPPEVFFVNLPAILNQKEMQTNIRLEPFDRIHIGQTRSSKMACYMPPWFRWFCKKDPEKEKARKEKAATPPTEGAGSTPPPLPGKPPPLGPSHLQVRR